MPALPNTVLYAKLKAALPTATVFQTAIDEVRPAIAHVSEFGIARLYLWTVTADRSRPGARPAGEMKIQLILPGQERYERGALELSGPYTALLGYSPDFGVFAGWEASLYDGFAYSANVQVREELLAEARDHGWAVAPPRQRGHQEEVRVAFTAGNMLVYLLTSQSADDQRLAGKRREAFFLSQTPNVEADVLPISLADVEVYIDRERQRVAATRFLRSAKFGPNVKKEFDYGCALCGLQLEIIESAHIIPVHERGGEDEVWNGIALCPNHHRLFDARSFVVAADLCVQIDNATVQFLRDCNHAQGIEMLTGFDRKFLRHPHFWTVDIELQARMRSALKRRLTVTGVI